ncbi:hypothetical protein QTP88_014251 [Uroleucon formosanum]
MELEDRDWAAGAIMGHYTFVNIIDLKITTNSFTQTGVEKAHYIIDVSWFTNPVWDNLKFIHQFELMLFCWNTQYSLVETSVRLSPHYPVLG